MDADLADYFGSIPHYDVAPQLMKRRKQAPVISPLAVEAVRRIDAIFDVESAISGRSAQDLRIPPMPSWTAWSTTPTA